MPTIKYSSYLEINPSFESVVDIDADKRQPTMWRDYIVGDDMENLIEQMANLSAMKPRTCAVPSGSTAHMAQVRVMLLSLSSI